MPRLSRTAAALTIAVAASLASGCAAVRPEPAPVATMSVVVPAPADAVLATLRNEAIRLGGTVMSETADSFTADYGVEPRRITVTAAGALGAGRTEWLETEVHSSATYFARATDGGTLVSVAEESIWWHPDRRVWLRMPADAPSASGPR